MLRALPYETYFGSKISVDKVKQELTKYLGSVDVIPLQYEYVIDNKFKLAFIIGKNQDEKELPMWEHPILIENIKNGPVLAIDLRRYVKNVDNTDDIMYLAEHIKDKNHVDFITLRAMLTSEFLNENYCVLTPVVKNISTAFALTMSTIVGTMVNLTVTEKMYIEFVSFLYINFISSDSEDVEHICDIAAARAASSKLSGSVSKPVIDKVYSMMPIAELYKNFNKTPQLLVSLLKQALSEDKRDLVELEGIYNTIHTMWYGPGGSEAMVIAIEHLPTLAALINFATNDSSFKRTRISVLLDKFKRSIVPADLEKYFKGYIKNKTLSI